MAESYRERLLRVFPNTDCDKNGTPRFCRAVLSGDVVLCQKMNCEECWNEEAEGEKDRR